MGGLRPEKVANEIREHISTIIHEELKDPRIGFITIMRIEVTPDIRNAKIFFSVLGGGGKEEKERAIEGLNSAAGFIKKLLGERMRIRFTPDLIFRLDESAEYSLHLEKIFDMLNKEKDKKK